MTVTYPYSEIIESVKSRLKYIAGKRAGNDTFQYYQFTACNADNPILIKMAGETIAWIAVRLGGQAEGYSIAADEVRMEIKARTQPSPATETILMETIVQGIITRWLRLTGYPDTEPWEIQTEGLADLLVEGLRERGNGTRRKLTPI